jgi:hypothetical protein
MSAVESLYLVSHPEWEQETSKILSLDCFETEHQQLVCSCETLRIQGVTCLATVSIQCFATSIQGWTYPSCLLDEEMHRMGVQQLQYPVLKRKGSALSVTAKHVY